MRHFLLAISLLGAALPVDADSGNPQAGSQARGLEIARAAEEKFSGYGDSSGLAVMHIRTGDGAEAERGGTRPQSCGHGGGPRRREKAPSGRDSEA